MLLDNFKIPEQFHILQNNKAGIIEIKSLYHYWKFTEGNNIIILSHKYNKFDKYHKQKIFYNPNTALKYIIKHDEYISSRVAI